MGNGSQITKVTNKKTTDWSFKGEHERQDKDWKPIEKLKRHWVYLDGFTFFSHKSQIYTHKITHIFSSVIMQVEPWSAAFDISNQQERCENNTKFTWDLGFLKNMDTQENITLLLKY